MKKLISILLVLMMGAISTPILAQDQLILDRFNALVTNGQVTLTIVIRSGSTCAGINIYRSESDSNFQLIGDIPGICGSTSEAVQYVFTDAHPIFNTLSLYKIELGGIGFSDVLTVTIRDLKNEDVSIQPNPSNSQTHIYFSNPLNAVHTLKVFNYLGTSLFELKTSTDEFQMDVTPLRSGIYPFILITSQSKARKYGSIVVSH